MTPKVVAYRDENGQLNVYSTVYDDDEARAARIDCAITRKLPLERVQILHPGLVNPAGARA
jgi:hypothetical protein